MRVRDVSLRLSPLTAGPPWGLVPPEWEEAF